MVLSTSWQHSKLNISSLIKLDPALRQQCGPGNLQRFLQTSVIQCFQRPPDSRGTRLWYFEVLRLHGPNPHEANREAKGGTRSGDRRMRSRDPSRQHGTSTAICRCGRTASVAGEERDRHAGMETGSSGRVEPNAQETRLRFHGNDSARSEGKAPQLPITRAKSLKGGKSKLNPLHPHTLSRIPLRLRSARVNPRPGLVRRLLTAQREEAL